MLQALFIIAVCGWLFSRKFKVEEKDNQGRSQFQIAVAFFSVFIAIWAIQKFFWKYVIFSIFAFIFWPFIRSFIKEWFGIDLRRETEKEKECTTQ